MFLVKPALRYVLHRKNSPDAPVSSWLRSDRRTELRTLIINSPENLSGYDKNSSTAKVVASLLDFCALDS